MVRNRLDFTHVESVIDTVTYTSLIMFTVCMLSYLDHFDVCAIYYIYLFLWCCYSFFITPNVFISAVLLFFMAWIDVVSQSVPGYLTTYFLSFMMFHWYPIRHVHKITYYILSICAVLFGMLLFFYRSL